jgi:CCR4-NOT transcription complex subunit 1
MNIQLFVIKGILDAPPDAFPIFNMANSPPPSIFARIVNLPSPTSSQPQSAQTDARELQGAGVYNSMGFITLIVKVFEMSESDTADESLYEAVNIATSLIDLAMEVAPELVLLGLEKMGVSHPYLCGRGR